MATTRQPTGSVRDDGGRESVRRRTIFLAAAVGVVIGAVGYHTVDRAVNTNRTTFGCHRLESRATEQIKDEASAVFPGLPAVARDSSGCEDTGSPNAMVTVADKSWKTMRDARRVLVKAGWLPLNNDHLYLSRSGDVTASIISDWSAEHAYDRDGVFVLLQRR